VERQRDLADSTAHADATCTTCTIAQRAANCMACHKDQDSETDFFEACWKVLRRAGRVTAAS
jgi:uncharacterized protein with ATP-grasp and redox domains